MELELFLSVKRFDHKPTKQEKTRLKFKRASVSVEELYNHIKEGGAFSNLYDFCYPTNFSSKQIKEEHPKENHYIGSYTINIDCDHQEETMEDCYNRVKIKPTFCYTTSSNGKYNDESKRIEYSYRFIYVFDTFLSGAEIYKRLYYSITTSLKLKYDVRARSPYQNMFGNCNCQSIFSGKIHSLDEFDLNLVDRDKKVSKTTQTTTHHNISPKDTFLDQDFLEDYKNLSYNDIYKKYKDRYRNDQHSELPMVDYNTKMIELPQDFYEITRLFDYNGTDKGMCKRLTYGMHRKRMLLFNLMIRRMINPDLTYNELLFDLCYEMSYYIDNSNTDHHISKGDLTQIALTAISEDIEEYKSKYVRPRNCAVNPYYIVTHNTTKKKVSIEYATQKHKEKKEELWNKIGELYDCSLKDKENLALLKEYGIKISLITFKRWKKENGLTKVRTKNTEKPTLQAPQEVVTQEVDSCKDEELEFKREWYFSPHSRLEDLDLDTMTFVKKKVECGIDWSSMPTHSLLDDCLALVNVI